jgi:hypothetical protein
MTSAQPPEPLPTTTPSTSAPTSPPPSSPLPLPSEDPTSLSLNGRRHSSSSSKDHNHKEPKDPSSRASNATSALAQTSSAAAASFKKTFNAQQLKKLAYPLAYPFHKLKQKTMGHQQHGPGSGRIPKHLRHASASSAGTADELAGVGREAGGRARSPFEGVRRGHSWRQQCALLRL